MSPEESKRLSTLATRFIHESRAQWQDLVSIGAALNSKQLDVGAKRLAEQTGMSAATIKRRFLAVKHGIEMGFSQEALIKMGQQATVAQYVREKVKKRTLPLVAFPHRLTAPIRDDLQVLCERIGKVLKLKTYDDVFEFILSTYADLPDEELLHLAGESNGTRTKQADTGGNRSR